MTIDKGKATGDLGLLRYERDHTCITTLETNKTAERDKVVADRKTANDAYMGMGEL